MAVKIFQKKAGCSESTTGFFVDPTIDIIKGMAIILVVYGHVIEHGMAPNAQDFFLNPVFKLIYTFHMPLFVFMSGYLMAFSLSRRSLRGAFKVKCKSLLVPFLSLGVLGIAVSYFFNVIFGKAGGVFNFSQDLIDQLLLRPSAWFLFTLFILSALLIYSIHLEKRLGVVGFLSIYFLMLVIPYNDYCCIYYIKWFYLFFLTGYLINRYHLRITYPMGQTAVFFISLIMFIGLVPFWTTQDYIYINKMNFVSNQYFHEILRIMYRYFMGFLGIIISFYIGAKLSRTKIAPVLRYVGTYALDIYIIQMCIVEGVYPRLVYKMHSHLDFNSPLVLYILAPLLVIFFVGLCMLISKLLIRKNSLLGRLLLGGRV